MNTVFWILFLPASTFLIISVLLYPMLIHFLLVVKKRKIKADDQMMQDDLLPSISLVIPCHNESEIILEKLQNSIKLNYPRDKIEIIFVPNGCTDNTAQLLREANSEIRILEIKEKVGKFYALQQAVRTASHEIIFITDANVSLYPESLKTTASHFSDRAIGIVAPLIKLEEMNTATALNEKIYTKNDEILRENLESLRVSVVTDGAFYAIHKSVFPTDSNDRPILDDAYIAMECLIRKRRIKHLPIYLGEECGVASVGEELKRRIRIAEGIFQLFTSRRVFTVPFKYNIHLLIRKMLKYYAVLFLVVSFICFVFTSYFINVLLVLPLILLISFLHPVFLSAIKNLVYVASMMVCIFLGFFNRLFTRGKDGAWGHGQRYRVGAMEINQPVQHGKIYYQNMAAEKANGEILIFSDANVILQKESIKQLIRSFQDSRVACVSGNVGYYEEKGGGRSLVIFEKLYWEGMKLIKQIESKLNYLLAVDGGFYAVRKEQLQKIPNNLLSDFLSPALTHILNLKCRFEKKARAKEGARMEFEAVLIAHRRVVSRALNSFEWLIKNFNMYQSGVIYFALIVFKVCLYLFPFFLFEIILLSVLSPSLAISKFVIALTVITTLLIALSFRTKNRIFSIFRYFAAIVSSFLLGYIDYLFGIDRTSWKTGR